MSAAADNLANQAERQRQAGDYVGAAATLERALRIRPQEAYLWNRLARVRMEQGQHGQAGNLAARSNALSKDQSDLKRDNWSMIAVSRRVAGDAAGAAEAEQKARDGG
jgi:Tfp pilus assembly protein PilF